MQFNSFSVFTGTLLLAVSPIFAAGSLDNADGVEQTLVTASRAPLALNRVGNATTVITALDIERRQSRYVTDLLRSVPGFSVSRSGVEGAQTQVRVRGAESNHVLVLIDGVRASDPASGDDFRWEQLTTGNIERIEIVRGAQSALWGSDAIAGVVNIITRSASSNSIGGYVEGGSYQTANGGVDGALRTDGWRLSGGVERVKTDGISIARDGVEDDDSDTTTATFAVSHNDDGDSSFDFRLRAVDAHSQTDPSDFVTGLPVDGNSVTDSKTLSARALGKLRTHDGKVTHSLTGAWFDSRNEFLTDDIQSSDARSDRQTLAYQADIKFGGDQVSLAAEREETNYEQRGVGLEEDMRVTSLIADYQGLSFGQFTWLVSGRYDNNSEFDNSFNGRVSLAYELSDVTRLRANVGTGRKNPTFTERFSFFPGLFFGNPDLKPEKSVSYEAGIDQQFIDGAVRTQLSVFHQDLEDEINGFVFDPDLGGFTAQNKIGDSQRTGAELAATWTVNPNLELGAQYTYTDAKEKDAAGVETREIRRPRHEGGLRASLNSDSNRFGLTVAADYSGTRTDTLFVFPAQTVTLGNYWLVDVTAQFRINENLTLFLRGANVLDEDYQEVVGYSTLGDTWYLGLRASFGG